MQINLNDFVLDKVVKELSKKYHGKKESKKDIKVKGDMEKKKEKDKEKVVVAGIEMERGQLKKIAKANEKSNGKTGGKEMKVVKVPKTKKLASCLNVEFGD